MDHWQIFHLGVLHFQDAKYPPTGFIVRGDSGKNGLPRCFHSFLSQVVILWMKFASKGRNCVSALRSQRRHTLCNPLWYLTPKHPTKCIAIETGVLRQELPASSNCRPQLWQLRKRHASNPYQSPVLVRDSFSDKELQVGGTFPL